MRAKRLQPKFGPSGEPPNQGDSLRIRTSTEIAAIWNARTGERMTDADVRQVLLKAHKKLADKLGRLLSDL